MGLRNEFVMRLRSILGRPGDTKHTMAVCLAFSIVFGILFLISNGFHFTVQGSKTSLAETDAKLRLGEIRLAPSKDGSCRAMKFDNRSGQFGEQKMIDCDADPTPQLGRFESIRKSFNGR
jgi:hypothetical protein